MGISAKPSVFAEPGLEADKRNRNAVVKYLGPLLGSAKKPARLYYFETCEANDSDPLAFPRLTVRPPSNGKKGLDAVRKHVRRTCFIRRMRESKRAAFFPC
jgi:hypothetical protein